VKGTAMNANDKQWEYMISLLTERPKQDEYEYVERQILENQNIVSRRRVEAKQPRGEGPTHA
jgi:hypothetical protein